MTFLEQEWQPAGAVAERLAEFVATARMSLNLALYDFQLSEAATAPIVEALRGVGIRIAYDAGKRQAPGPLQGVDRAPPGTANFVRRLGASIQSKPITGGQGAE